MKKLVSLLLCLMLALLPVTAPAAVRMPESRGAVTDDANVLSAQTAADLEKYAERLEKATGIALHVALVHFWDGAEAQTYADTLFDRWELGSDHLLVVGAAGEDAFAASFGQSVSEKLGKSNAENLLFTSSAFASLFRTQQYDAAFADYCKALSDLVKKQNGETVRVDGLFGYAAPTVGQQAQVFGSELWSDIMESIADSSEDYYEHHARERREDNGLSAGGWIVLIILVMIMLRRNKYERKRRPGCLGWLFSLFGINILIDILRGRRR